MPSEGNGFELNYFYKEKISHQPPFITVHTCMFWFEKLEIPIRVASVLIQGYFCAVYNYGGKTDLSKGS